MASPTTANADYKSIIELQFLGCECSEVWNRHATMGMVFQLTDRRIDPNNPIEKIIRILPNAANAIWKKSLDKQVSKLCSTPLPYIAAPRGMGLLKNGDAFLISDNIPFDVATYVAGDRTLKVDRVAAIGKQAVLGLAALHRRGIVHGGIRPTNIRLDQNPTDGSDVGVTISDAAIGQLPTWSNGLFVEPDATLFAPPANWPKTPMQADVYALGVTLLTMLSGEAAVQAAITEIKRKELANNQIKRLSEWNWGRCWSKLIDLVCFWRPRRDGAAIVVSNLLREVFQSNEPPQDGTALLGRLQKSEVKGESRLGLVRLGIATLFWLATALIAIRFYQSGLFLAENVRTINDLKRENEKLQKENDELREKTKKPDSKDLVLERAQKQWGLADSKTKLFDLADELEKSGQPDDKKAAQLLRDWFNEFDDLNKRGRPWIDEDTKFTELHSKARSEPWEGIQPALTRLADLNKAADTWIEWADKDKTNAQIDSLLTAITDGSFPILRDWLAQLRGNDHWTLRLIEGKDNGNHGKSRGFSIGAKDCFAHDWETETAYDYSENPGIRDNEFDWSGGNLTLSFVRPRIWRELWSTGLVSKTYTGPLAISKLHRDGGMMSNSTMLRFEILNCPGPPRRYRQPISDIVFDNFQPK